MVKTITRNYVIAVIIAIVFFLMMGFIGTISLVTIVFVGIGGVYSVIMVFASIPMIFYFRHHGVDKHILYLPLSYLAMFLLSVFFASQNQALIIFQVVDYIVKILTFAYAIYVFEKKVPLVQDAQTQVPQSKLATIAIIVAILSFIPVYGIFLGIGAIILGVMVKKQHDSKLGNAAIVLGILGIIFTFALYGFLFYFGFMHREGIFDNMRAENVKTQMHDTVNAIEAYKARFGEYPEFIENLTLVSGNPALLTDEVQVGIMTRNFVYYYERRNDSYYLFSRGFDGIPFTDDDIHPLFETESGKIGLTKPPEKIK